MDIKQEKGNPYIIPQYIKSKRSIQFKKQRNNHSLPSINGPFKQDKVNAIRNQIDDTKNQITTLKARINALKIQKQRNQKKKQKHSSQINFIHTVRERLYQEKKYKQDIQQKRDKQLEYLKQQANNMRQKMTKDRELAKSIVNQQKQAGAQQERQKRKDDEDSIKRVKNIQLAENQLKAKSIKQIQLQIEQRMKQFNQSRVAFSKQNHHQRVQRSLSEKEKLQRTVRKLKKEQERMLEECKKSEVNMLSTLYELESLNPQRRRRNSISSKGTSIKFN